jgi:2-haloacid dehalogenase
MRLTLAFDVYGTLIDPLGITARLRDLVGDAAPVFAQLWRDKQIEYLYRRALMRQYVDFPTCTRQALAFADAQLATGLSSTACDTLMGQYLELPAYPDALPALKSLKSEGHDLYAFSNGHPDDLAVLLENAGLAAHLDGIVSVHAARSFKPDPAVYAHFLASTGADTDSVWLVSGNPFDVLGAQSTGWSAAWVRRDPRAVFDPWGSEPTAIIANLESLSEGLKGVTPRAVSRD